MTEWTELKNRVLIDALKRIDSLGVQYKIIAPDGKEYGTLVVAAPVPEKVRKRAPHKYPHNALRDYVLGYITTMGPGDEVIIPVGDFDLKSLQSSVSSRAGQMWGAGNYLTTRDPIRNGVEVLRVL
jgi:hypothetical protein